MKDSSSNYEVCVIGAGIAGLNAANTLINDTSGNSLNASDIIILEAQDYVGGRLLTTPSDKSKLGLRYDLGAVWFHDCLTNPILHKLNNLNDPKVFNLSTDGYFDDKDVQVFSSDHDGPIDLVSSKINRVIEDIEKFIEIYFHESLDVADVSLKHMIEKYISQYEALLTEQQKDICGRYLRYLETWYGITWDKISGKYAIMDHQGRNLYNKKGYSYLVDHLLRNIPTVRVQLNSPVKNINRRNKDNNWRYCIETKSGPPIYCNYIIVTVPQSILQLEPTHEYGIKWEPPLPTNIIDSFHTIHFGALGKVIFEFNNVWWDISQDRFEILANHTTDNNNKDDAPLQSLPAPFTYPAYIINMAAVYQTKSASSLVILTQSPLTEYLEAHPDKAWQYYEPMLAKICLPNETISAPINTLTSSWTQNPYVRGSYSALHVDDDPSDLIIQLSAEFTGTGLYDECIRFAGEHTISDGAGCVHGAYTSGARAAEWVLGHKSPTLS